VIEMNFIYLLACVKQKRQTISKLFGKTILNPVWGNEDFSL